VLDEPTSGLRCRSNQRLREFVMPIFAEILGWEILVPVALIVILFGGSKIPQLARSLGQAKNEFAKGMSEADAAESDNTSESGGTADEK
jgi:sec-independent protein translocase protein TatA